MANRYISGSGSDTSPYDTWAKAATTLQTAMTGSAANDVFYVDSAWSDLAVVSTDLTYPSGTKINPLIFISVDKTGDPEPPTASDYLRGANYGAAGTFRNVIMTDTDCGAVFIGFEIEATNDINFNHSGVNMTLIDCGLTLNGTISSDRVYLSSSAGFVHFIGCDFSYGHVGQGVNLAGRSVAKFWDCKIKSGSAAVTGAITLTNWETQICEVHGFDCTHADTTAFEFLNVATLSTVTSAEGQQYRFYGIKLPANGVITNTSIGDPSTVVEWYSCSNATGEVQGLGKATLCGTVSDDTGVVLDRTHDGTNKYSIALTCNDKTRSGIRGDQTLRFLLGEKLLTATNATITAHAIEDHVTAALDDEIWLEIEYPDATDEQLALGTDTLAAGYFMGTSTAVTTESDPGWSGAGVTAMSNKNFYAPTKTLTSGVGVVRVYAVIAFGATRTVYFEPGFDVT